MAVVVAAADETSHAEARLAKPSQASQSREGLTNGIGYFCDGRGQAQGLITGRGTGYTQFVNGPADEPTRGGDGGAPTNPCWRAAGAACEQEHRKPFIRLLQQNANAVDPPMYGIGSRLSDLAGELAKSRVQDSHGDPDLGDSQWHNQSKSSAWPAQACQEIPIPLTIQVGGRRRRLRPVSSILLVFLGRLVLVMHSTLIGYASGYLPNQPPHGYPGLLI